MLKLTGSLRVLVSSNTLRIPEASMCRIRSAIQRSGDLDIQSFLRLMNRKIEQVKTEETENTKARPLCFLLLSPVRAHAAAYCVRGSWLTACAAHGSPLQ